MANSTISGSFKVSISPDLDAFKESGKIIAEMLKQQQSQIPAPKIPAPELPKDFGLAGMIQNSIRNTASKLVAPLKDLGSKMVAPVKAGAKYVGDGVRSVLVSAIGETGTAAASSFVQKWGGALVRGTGSVAASAASGITSAIGSAAVTGSKLLGDALSSSAKIAGAAVATALGTSLSKGWGRLESIDTARTKLSALGNSAEDVAVFMEKATNAVTGTSFGLGDSAAAIASLSAAKVPMDQLDKSMSAMVSTAALAGAPLEEMSLLFSQAAASGKLDGGIMMSLMTRQVPILAMIQEKYGVTAEAAKQMVSEGKVSFQDMVDILGQNSEAAAIMGTSMQGLASNTGAAMGRFGAALQQPFFEALKVALPGVISLFDALTKAVKPVSELILPQLTGAAEKFATAMASIQFNVTADGARDFGSAIIPLLPVVLGIAGAFGGLLSSLPLVGPLFAGISGPVGILVGALAALTLFSPEQLTNGFNQILEALPGIIEKIVGTVTTVLPKLVENLAANLPILITGFANMLLQLIPAIVGIIPLLVDAIITLIPALINALLLAFPLLLNGAIQLLMAIVVALPEIIIMLVQMLPSLINQLADALIAAAPIVAQAAVELFFGLLVALPQVITELLKVLPQIFWKLVQALVVVGYQLLAGLWDGIVKYFPKLISNIIDMLSQLWKTFLEFFGIHSPSRLMADTVGKQIGAGIAVGITDSTANVLNSVDDFNSKLYSELAPDLEIEAKLRGAGSDIGYRANGDVINVYNELQKPDSLADLERAQRRGITSGVRSR